MTTGNSTRIHLDGLTKEFGRTLALDRLSLTVAAGEVFALLGPNGAGKTTTIKLLCGLLRPTAGRAAINGHDVERDPLAAKADLAYVPDQPYVYPKLTGREFLRLVCDLYRLPAEESRPRMDDLIDLFEMGDYVDDLTQNYSHGMKQRLVMAAALVHEPSVIVVDEPMVGLDPKSSRLVKDILRERAAAGATVFVSTHTLSVADEVSDRVGILHHGRLVALGPPAEIRSQQRSRTLEDAFLQITAETMV
jgi:ABC-2 type transport system ATP-binding protein